MLGLDEVLRIGRGVSLQYVGQEHAGHWGRATFLVSAPTHVAVSRDDFTREDHLELQAQREHVGRESEL